MKSTWGHILQTLEHGSKLPVWLLTFIISLLPIYFLPSMKISALWIAPVALILLFFVWVLFRAVSDALALVGMNQLPSVVSVYNEPGGDCILLLSASRLFGQGIRVSIYFETESGFEVRIGQGVVRNIQDNGLIQVAVQNWEEAHSSVAQRIAAQEKEAFTRTSVKPATDETGNGVDYQTRQNLMLSLLAEIAHENVLPQQTDEIEELSDE